MAYPVSARFATELASSTVSFSTSVTVLSDGQPVPGFAGLAVESLTVTASRSSAQRFSVTAVLTASPAIVPVDLSSPLTPNGNEIQCSVDVLYPDGTSETVPLGIFPITDVAVDDSGTDITLTVTASDRSWSISRRALLQPYTIPTNTTLDQALAQLVALGSVTMPPFATSITPTTSLAAVASYQDGQDPWQAATDLANAYGWEIFFGRSANLLGYTTPNPATSATAWTYTETHGSGLGILGLTRTLTASQIVNDVFVTGVTSTGAAIRAEVFDANKSSPTYIGGPFGDIPSFQTTSTATDVTAMTASAQTALVTALGQIDTVSLECLPNPAIDIDDIVSVTRARSGLINALYVVDGYSLTRTVGGTMTLTLRRVVA